MNDLKLDRLFKWIDFARVILYVLLAGVVTGAVWCTKIQLELNDVKGDLAANQANAQHYRDLHNQEKLAEEHRLTAAETEITWLKRLSEKNR